MIYRILKNIFIRKTKFFKFTLILFLVFSWVFNFLPINLDGRGWSRVLLLEKDFVSALRFRETRAVNIAEAVTTTAITPVKAISIPLDKISGPDAIFEHTDGIVLEAEVNEEEIVTEKVSELEIQTEPPSLPLYIRILKRNLITDKKVADPCEIKIFRVDIFGRATVFARIITHDSSSPYNGAYRYAEGASATSTDTFNDEKAMTTESIVTPDASSGPLKVIYTPDGVQWKSLGFVDKDQFGNKYFEIPIEAADWDLISNIQIGIQSVPVVDGIVPTIYLDSVWLEMECGRSWDDPYLPPRGKEGDIIISEVSSGDVAAVLVERKPSFVLGNPIYELWLSTQTPEQSDNFISNTEMAFANESLALQGAKIAKVVSVATSASIDSAMSTIETVMVESSDPSSSIPMSSVDASNVSSFYLLQRKEWRFITDISLSANTQIMIADGNIFWFKPDGGIVWRFNISSNAYESVSVNPGELLQLHFENQTGEPRVFQKSIGGSAEILEIIE